MCSQCKHNGYGRITGWGWIKKRILIRDNHECQLCHRKDKLHIHHKDKNRYNNKLKNLITYCVYCHESQHKNNFKKPIKVTVLKYGTKLKYEHTKEYTGKPRVKKKPKFFIKPK